MILRSIFTLSLLTTVALDFCQKPAWATIFNDVLPGARPIGMGMAYVAVSDDPYGMFYNPAGLAGSNFTQLGGGLGRMISPIGLVSVHSVTYTRPLPVRPGATVGAGLFVLRQDVAGDKDAFLLHFSDSIRIPQLYLSNPVKFGSNFKFVQVDNQRENKGTKFGFGFDGGLIVEDGRGLQGGISVTDLVTSVGVPNPSFTFGASYRWKQRVLFAADLRVRPGLSHFFPGVEMNFFQNLLKLRFGKGLPLDGVSQFAFGAGVDFSPLIMDFALVVPFQGFNRSGGAFQATVNYKFGAPAFYGRFVGSAARDAENLRSEIFSLGEKKKNLQTQVNILETNKASLEQQTKGLELRSRELQDQMRKLQVEVERTAYQSTHPAIVEAPKPKAPVAPSAPKPRTAAPLPFPRQHVVQPGETLRSIAQTHYGDPTLWELIYESNPDKIERGLPVEGKVLAIPAPKGSP